jgi:hypothetical protein
LCVSAYLLPASPATAPAPQFSNLCGTVYSGGNLIFTPDGNSLLSPVGNRVTVFDLVKCAVSAVCRNPRVPLTPHPTPTPVQPQVVDAAL